LFVGREWNTNRPPVKIVFLAFGVPKNNVVLSGEPMFTLAALAVTPSDFVYKVTAKGTESAIQNQF
jgi:hypothetical protein